MRHRRIATRARRYWYAQYRQTRIAVREHGKVFNDAVAYGNGVVEVGESVPDLIRHVPLEEWFREPGCLSDR